MPYLQLYDQVKQRKFEVLDKSDIMAGLLSVLAANNPGEEIQRREKFMTEWQVGLWVIYSLLVSRVMEPLTRKKKSHMNLRRK